MTPLSRRDLLRRAGLGFGGLALTSLLAEEGRLRADDGTLDPAQLNGKARSVILLFMGGGPSQIDDRPSLGSWLAYGLGSASKDLPAFVVMLAGESGRSAAWSSGFLPPAYQGTVTTAAGIPNVAPPTDVSPGARKAQLDLIGEL